MYKSFINVYQLLCTHKVTVEQSWECLGRCLNWILGPSEWRAPLSLAIFDQRRKRTWTPRNTEDTGATCKKKQKRLKIKNKIYLSKANWSSLCYILIIDRICTINNMYIHIHIYYVKYNVFKKKCFNPPVLTVISRWLVFEKISRLKF